MDFLNKTCITCKNFGWWDGDYCCTAKLRILQESPDGAFNNDILLSLRINKNCDSYIELNLDENKYIESFKTFLETKNH